MGDFIRPEARAALARWREALAGAALAALGLWWALGSHGLLAWLGWALAGLGAILAVTGAQRGLFRTAALRAGGGGFAAAALAGSVQLDEGRLIWQSAEAAGAVEMGELEWLAWRPGTPGHWLLADALGTRLAVPADAEGAEALFDAFAALPGLSPARLISVQASTSAARVILWQRGTLRQAPRLTAH